MLELHDVLECELRQSLVYAAADIVVDADALVAEIREDDVSLSDALRRDALHGSLLSQFERRLRLRHCVENVVEHADAVHHLVVLRDDICISMVGLLLLALRCAVVGECAVSKSAALAQFLEHDAVHAATEILVEQRNLSLVLRSPLLVLVVQLHHVDVLSIVRREENLVLRSLHHLVRLVLRRILQSLRRDMVLVDCSNQLLHSERTVVNHVVLIVLQRSNHVDNVLRIGRYEFCAVGRVACRVVLAVESVVAQRTEVSLLVELSVASAFQQVVYVLVVSLAVYLCVVEHLLHELHSLGHVLAETAERYSHRRPCRVEAVFASQLVEALLNLCSRHRSGAEQVEIVGSVRQPLVSLRTEIVHEVKLEEVVLLVLYVVNRLLLLCSSASEVLFVVEEYRLYRLHLRLLDLLHQCALQVAVRRYRRDSRLLYFLLCRVFALTLVDDGVAVGEVALGEVHNLLLCDACDAVEALHLRLPRASVNEGVDERCSSTLVAVERAQELELHVVLHRRQQLVAELATLQLLYLAEHDSLHLVERLSLVGLTDHDELRVVAHVNLTRLHTLAEHLLVYVDVDESGVAVGEHVVYHVERVSLQRSRAVHLPAEEHVLSLLSDYGSVNRRREVLHRCEVRVFHLFALLPRAEVLVDDSHHSLRVEVARHTDSHVVRHIVVLEVVLYIRD